MSAWGKLQDSLGRRQKEHDELKGLDPKSDQRHEDRMDQEQNLADTIGNEIDNRDDAHEADPDATKD